jgi:hypothetical protein
MIPLKLRERGYQFLVEQLGQVKAIRFLQQLGWGSGDYTQERKERLDYVTRENFWQNLREMRNK